MFAADGFTYAKYPDRNLLIQCTNDGELTQWEGNAGWEVTRYKDQLWALRFQKADRSFRIYRYLAVEKRWEMQSVLPQGAMYSSLLLHSERTFWIEGFRKSAKLDGFEHFIALSTDGGKSWEEIARPKDLNGKTLFGRKAILSSQLHLFAKENLRLNDDKKNWTEVFPDIQITASRRPWIGARVVDHFRMGRINNGDIQWAATLPENTDYLFRPVELAVRGQRMRLIVERVRRLYFNASPDTTSMESLVADSCDGGTNWTFDRSLLGTYKMMPDGTVVAFRSDDCKAGNKASGPCISGGTMKASILDGFGSETGVCPTP